jgi:hypothetical protein
MYNPHGSVLQVRCFHFVTGCSLLRRRRLGKTFSIYAYFDYSLFQYNFAYCYVTQCWVLSNLKFAHELANVVVRRFPKFFIYGTWTWTRHVVFSFHEFSHHYETLIVRQRCSSQCYGHFSMLSAVSTLSMCLVLLEERIPTIPQDMKSRITLAC